MRIERYIDLHTHTNASDGSYSPAGLVRYAQTEGLSAIAVTDHDTVAGVAEALEESKKTFVEVIPGVELSADFRPEMHILGYFKNNDYAGLEKILKNIRKKRFERNPVIIRNLNKLGFDISMDEVSAESGGNVTGRAHIAGVMVKKGFVGNVAEAFKLYLGEGKAAYQEREKLSPARCVEEINRNGGLAVLAHPIYLGLETAELEILVKKLMDYGLKGIEVYYTDHSQKLTADYEKIARKFNLLVTGGSDFHGSYKPDIKLGKGFGKLYVPYRILEELKSALKE